MTKKITTGTEITFKKTGEKFTITQTDTGFDVKQIKLSKNVPAEPYSFQELLDMFENGLISIEGFEETDSSHIKAILTGYIHQAIVKEQLLNIDKLKQENDSLKQQIEEFKKQIIELNQQIEALDTALEAMQEEETEG